MARPTAAAYDRPMTKPTTPTPKPKPSGRIIPVPLADYGRSYIIGGQQPPAGRRPAPPE